MPSARQIPSIHRRLPRPIPIRWLDVTGELRAAEWREIDLDAAQWRIPATKMKMKIEHLVPLATQAVAILRELYQVMGDGKNIFPSSRTDDTCMSENTINAALRGMGYARDVMTGHGFRATRTIMDEVLGASITVAG